MRKWQISVSAGVLSVALMMSGCTTNPYTGQQQASKTGLGAGIGAAGGAVIGQLIGHNTASTLIGASLGAAVGGVAGNIMDRQAAALRQQLQGSGVQVVLNGNDIQLIMLSDITFAVNKAEIKPEFYNVLNSVALVLKEYKGTIIQVAGYTDNTGTVARNQTLSEQRAQSVATYLSSQGVDSRRFTVIGYGQRQPVASNSTADGRAKNRRVELTLHSVQ